MKNTELQKIKQATMYSHKLLRSKNKFIDFLTKEIQTRKSEIIMANKRDLRNQKN